jgi:hypothetical protein
MNMKSRRSPIFSPQATRNGIVLEPICLESARGLPDVPGMRSYLMGAAVVILSCMVLALPADGQGSTNDAIARFLKVMDGISYDATIAVDMLDYADGTPATPEIVDIETNRDVFAVGFGRRLERSVKGKDNGSGVIDWKTATSMRPRLARAFMVMLPGLTYLEYINPDTGYGTFLSDACSASRNSGRKTS